MYWNITFWYSFFQCHYLYSLLFNSGFIKRNRDTINDTDVVKISPYIAVKLVKVSVHGCFLCYISGQVCYRLVSSAMGKENWHGQNMNKLKSLKTTRTYERKPALASVFHHFQSLREKPVLFTMGLHVHLTKDGKAEEGDWAEAGSCRCDAAPHQYSLQEDQQLPCTNCQRRKIWLLLHLHFPYLTNINFS